MLVGNNSNRRWNCAILHNRKSIVEAGDVYSVILVVVLPVVISSCFLL